ncbi:hypothetical protein H0H93_016833, partial [Arthromyces matolae]
NLNKNLKYLNLSGNKRLQIYRVEKRQTYYGHTPAKHPNAPSSNMSSFAELTQLRVLGLMDVTLPTVRGTADTPEENEDRRVRTSASTIMKMSYGIADALGKNDTLNLLDLVQEIRPASYQNNGALFAMFGRSAPHRGAGANRLAKYLRDRFVGNFVSELDTMEKHADDVSDALR